MISTLKRHFPTTKNAELADLLGVSTRTISRKAKELGLIKDESWMIEVATEKRNLRESNQSKKIKGNRKQKE
jgi:transcriptional antiterminator